MPQKILEINNSALAQVKKSSFTESKQPTLTRSKQLCSTSRDKQPCSIGGKQPCSTGSKKGKISVYSVYTSYILFSTSSFQTFLTSINLHTQLCYLNIKLVTIILRSFLLYLFSQSNQSDHQRPQFDALWKNWLRANLIFTITFCKPS